MLYIIIAIILITIVVLAVRRFLIWRNLLSTFVIRNKSYKNRSPVALIIGGTSGIGEGTALALAENMPKSHIIITGRNKTKGEQIVSKLNELSGSNNHEFIECDIMLKKNILEYTDRIKREHTKINFLVMTASPNGSFFKREETSEGIEKNMMASYYSRFLIIQELMPLLEKAVELGEEARVISVLAAGREKDVPLSDIECKNSYGISTLMVVSSTYNSLMCQSFADLHPKISFSHIYPGYVDTPLGDFIPLGGKYLLKYTSSLFGTYKSLEDFGQVMNFVLTDDKYKTGSHFLGEFGDVVAGVEKYMTRNNMDPLWKHTLELLDRK